MKKTVSVNIKGTNFLIEEDAYELLQDYLERLTSALQNEDGSNEIIEDVELRIAEICSSKLNDTKSVIELHDIEEILKNLGEPEEYVEEGEAHEQSFNTHKEHAHRTENTDKRLFRDTENAVIAGVCQGVANFFNIDVVIVRAIFAVIFLFGGFGLPLYILMWIIVPKAKNTIDRLRMKGTPVTVENVRQEVENAAERIKKGSKNVANRIRKDESYQRTVSNGGRVISLIFGIGFLGWGIISLIFFLIFGIGGFQFIPVQSDYGFLSFTDFSELIMADTSDANLLWTGSLIIGFSFVLFLLLLGIMLIARIKNKWAKISLIGLFTTGIVGVVICGYIGVKTGRDYAMVGELERKIGSVDTEQLVVSPLSDSLNSTSSFVVKGVGRNGLLSLDDQFITMQGVDFCFRMSTDSLFHVYQNKSSRSHSHKRGLERAKAINHSVALDSTTLHLSKEYKFPREDKIRDQEILIIIDIPEGKTLKIGNEIIQLGEDYSQYETTYFEEERGYLNGDGSYDHYY